MANSRPFWDRRTSRSRNFSPHRWAVTTCHRDTVSASAQTTLQSVKESVAITNIVECALHIYLMRSPDVVGLIGGNKTLASHSRQRAMKLGLCRVDARMSCLLALAALPLRWH
jgi:hypothetical protein